MPSLRYNDYYISVFHTPDKSDNSSCVPFVEIRHKSAHSPEARLMLNDAFGSAYDASAHGFAMGKQWIDQRVTQINPATSSETATKAFTKSPPIRFRLKSWLASLLL
jgi:hypothetical protein